MRMCAHLLHKHIKNTATCGIILTENYQLVKGLLYNQNYKKDIQVIRKEIKAIGLEPVDSEEKRDSTGDIYPGEWWFKPHVGHSSTRVLCRGDESPWLVGGLLGLTKGLWEAWTLLVREGIVRSSLWLPGFLWSPALRSNSIKGGQPRLRAVTC